MSAPVTPAAPSVRPASSPRSDGGGAESAAPFASALDGALSEGRAPVGDGSANADPQGTPDETPAEGTVTGEATATGPASAGVPAAIWALAMAGGASTDGEAPPADGDTAFPRGVAVAAGVGHVPGEAPGLAVAEARAKGVAAGLRAADAASTPSVPGPNPSLPAPGLPAGAAGVAATATGTAGAGAAQPAVATVPADLQAQLQAALDAATVSPVGTAATGTPATGAAATAADAAGALALATAVASGAGGATADGTPVPSATASPVPATGSGAGGSPSASGGGTDQDAGQSGAASGDGLTEVTGAGSGTTPVATPTAPAAKSDAATGAGAALPVGAQVARQVAVLRGAPDGAHTMTLVLTPETLGPVSVQVTVSQGTVDLTLRGAHEHGRAALLDALPDLRRDLETAGLSCSRLEVDRETGGSWSAQQFDRQQAFGDRPGQQDGSDHRSRPWLRSADTGEGQPARTTSRSTSSGVDVRV
jgi:flagellar hook-length control protein FliK